MLATPPRSSPHVLAPRRTAASSPEPTSPAAAGSYFFPICRSSAAGAEDNPFRRHRRHRALHRWPPRSSPAGLPHRLRLEPRSSPSAAAATFHRCPRRRRSHGLPQRHARSSGLPTLLSSRQHHHCVHRARSSLATTDAGAGPVLRGESMELGHIPTSWPPLHHYHGARWPLYRRALRCEADLASSTKRPLSAPRPRPLPQAHPCLPDDHLHHQHSMEYTEPQGDVYTDVPCYHGG
ncbi:hypothetical protein DAI22_01g262100 [Oryza sativa Japonica Group]|nr:hypothetical protein DAI22_01g262100 [Oryza sativa Japonica Group]